MIHNMWGNHKTFWRHVDWFNRQGYTCVTFNLFQASSISKDHSYTTRHYFSFMYRNWIHQITDVLDSIPGPKIIFSLSGPSLSGLIAASKRTDIEKYICDGGPFKNCFICTYRMFATEKEIKNPLLRFLWTMISCLYWGPFAFSHLTKALKLWNPKIPILSLRGAKDPIVFPVDIQAVFEEQTQIKIKIHVLKEGLHLDGIKNHPEEYTLALLNFLKDEKNNHLA